MPWDTKKIKRHYIFKCLLLVNYCQMFSHVGHIARIKTMNYIQLNRDEFGPRPGPAWPGPGLIEGHFWDLAHRGPGPFILAQVWPGPEKYGPNSTHRDEFRLRPSLARPGPGLIEGHFWGLARHGPGLAGPGPSSARAGKKRPKLIPIA